MPVTMARPAVSATNWCVTAGDTATLAADSAAVADIGPTTRWRELPARCVEDQRGDRCVQADHRRYACDRGVCERLGDQHRPYGEPGDRVPAQ